MLKLVFDQRLGLEYITTEESFLGQSAMPRHVDLRFSFNFAAHHKCLHLSVALPVLSALPHDAVSLTLTTLCPPLPSVLQPKSTITC